LAPPTPALQVCQKLQDIIFIEKVQKPKKRLNPDTGQLENVQGSSQASDVYFIHYPRSLDAIRFALQQMHQHALSAQNDEEALYYCPPRTVTRKKQVESRLRHKAGSLARITEGLTPQLRNPEMATSSVTHHAWEMQHTSSGSHFWRNTATLEVSWTYPIAAEASGEGPLQSSHAAEANEEEEHIGCANSVSSDRRGKRYTYLEYMNARVQVRNADTGADEWRHYCPWCLKNAKTQSKQTGTPIDGSLLPQLEKYTGAAVSVEDLDEVLLPLRLLLADLNPEHLVIPVDSNGVLFEDAMDKFEAEQRDRERMQNKRHSGTAEHVQQSVHVTLTDSTRLVAEEVTKEEKAMADKKQK